MVVKVTDIVQNDSLQVFTPTEKLESAAVLNLIFCQIVQDVFSNTCIRIAKEERMRTKSMLGRFQPA